MGCVVISAGHNRGTGASAVDGTDEWCWNASVVEAMVPLLEGAGHVVHVLERDVRLGYTAAMRRLAAGMRLLGADVALELHFNSADGGAHGYEFLHWWGSAEGMRLARCVAEEHGKAFPGISARGRYGVRSLWYREENSDRAYSGRGGAYVYLTPCPAVICEPGFASNISDWDELKDSADEVALGYVRGVCRYLEMKSGGVR